MNNECKTKFIFCITLFFTHLGCKNCDDIVVLPDLVCTSFTLIGDTNGITIGNPFRIRTIIKNNAELDINCPTQGASGVTAQRISLFYKANSDTTWVSAGVFTNRIPALQAGEEYDHQELLNITGLGQYKFYVGLDCENLVAESNETNNGDCN